MFIDDQILHWVLELEFLYDLRHNRLQFIDTAGDCFVMEDNARFQYFHNENDITKNPTPSMAIWYVSLLYTSKEAYNLLYIDDQDVYIFHISDGNNIIFDWNSITTVLDVLLLNLKAYNIKYQLLIVKPCLNMEDIHCRHKNYDELLTKYASNWTTDTKIESISKCYNVINCFNTRSKSTSSKTKVGVPNVIYNDELKPC